MKIRKFAKKIEICWKVRKWSKIFELCWKAQSIAKINEISKISENVYKKSKSVKRRLKSMTNWVKHVCWWKITPKTRKFAEFFEICGGVQKLSKIFELYWKVQRISKIKCKFRNLPEMFTKMWTLATGVGSRWKIEKNKFRDES